MAPSVSRRATRTPAVLTAALGAVVAVVLSLVLAPGTASAASGAGAASDAQWSAQVLGAPAPVTPEAVTDCPSGYFCFWVDSEFRGAMGKVRGSNASWAVFAQSTCASRTWDNCASSYWNRTGVTVIVYRDPNYGGPSARLDGTPRTVSSSWNDQISSNVVAR